MSDSYPYIQTLHGFDEGIGAYAIQPAGEANAPAPPEENPILAFGPLGRINIFVGATNAGKSRFLRTLAKNEGYAFYPSSRIYEAFRDVISLLDQLSKTTASAKLFVDYTKIQYLGVTPQHPGTALPPWVRQATPDIKPNSKFELTVNAEFFSRLNNQKWEFLPNRLERRTNAKSSLDLMNLGDDYQVLLLVRNLLRGEREIKSTAPNHSILARRWDNSFYFSIDESFAQIEDSFLRFVDSLQLLCELPEVLSQKPPQRIYIPILRSAVSLSDENGQRLGFDIFEKTVRRNYKLDDASLEIFTGNTLYETIRSDRNGTPEIVARLRDFERFLGAAFYEGRSVEIVALDTKYDEGQHIDVRVAAETPRQLHHLGDGINTLIILLYQLFMAQPGSWIFIEEPELNLHPGLQRVFLQTLLENEALQKRDLRVFFTTHSNHLLRMTLRDGTIASKDISVFAFQQRESNKDRFLIRPLLSEHHDALALLGVQNASVLLAQCGVWVEGPTDRQYVRAYLRAYQESAEFKNAKLRAMREDTHFAFWEYAGSNLAHYLMSGVPPTGTPAGDDYESGQKALLAQIQSGALCNRIFLLSDRDEKKANKHATLEALAQGRTNFVYFVTDGIEIENLLSPPELASVLPKFLKGTPPAIPSWKQPDYKTKRMGAFLKAKFSEANFPKSWKEKSGTLSTDRKNRLCELAVEAIEWKTMSNEAKALAKSLHTFLARHNAI